MTPNQTSIPKKALRYLAKLGQLATGLVFALPLMAATITVNSTGDGVADDGVCTLREAIIAANTNTVSGATVGECAAGTAGLNTIAFSVAGTLLPATALPNITTPIHIDGYTAPGAAKNTLPLAQGTNAQLKIEIDGVNTGNFPGISLVGAGASGSIIEGLVVNSSGNQTCCFQIGMYVKNVTGAATTIIRGNFFGTNVAGTVALPEGSRNIYIDSAANVQIGSAGGAIDDSARNVISGSFGAGIQVTSGMSNLAIRGNLIGTNAAGTAQLGNDRGIAIDYVDNGTIADNVISGNSYYGINLFQHINTVSVTGNFIGTNAAGAGSIPNGQIGMAIIDRYNVTPFTITNVDVLNNVVANNGCTLVAGCSGGIVVGLASPLNTTNGVRLSGNLVYANQGLQIDLETPNGANGYTFGVSANDAGDADGGPGAPNNLQNFPVLTPATGNGATISVPYTFDSEPNKSFTLEFFQASTCDASGHGGAQVYLGSQPVTTDGAGNANGTASLSSVLVTGVISATATNAVNGTSEFSLCTSLSSATPTIAPSFTSVAPPGGTLSSPYSYAVTANGSAPITFSVGSGSLPTGLTISSTGLISGTPTATGTFTGTITAANGTLPDASQPFSIVIAPITTAPSITSAAPPAGLLSTPYSYSVTATGSAPIVFSLGGGSLPNGLVLGAGGLISGTPTATGTFTGTIVAANGTLPNASQPFSIVIGLTTTAPTFSSAAPTGGMVGTAYNYSVTANGTAPITFSVGSGSLPPGLNISAGGLISGTPTSAGTFSGTLAAANGTLPNASQPFSIVIAPITSFTGPTATGSGSATASFTGGGPTCGFSNAVFIPVSGGVGSPPAGTAPVGQTFPHGLFDFTTSGCTPGSSLTFTVTYPQAIASGPTYWKYGPTPGPVAAHWYALPASIVGNTATFTIVDGALGDDDLTANGSVVDQGGPGVPGAGPSQVASIPSLNEWGVLALSGLLLLFGLFENGVRRSRAAASSGS